MYRAAEKPKYFTSEDLVLPDKYLISYLSPLT